MEPSIGENLEFSKLLHWLFWPVFPTPFHIGVNRQRINLYQGKTREKQITRGPEEISTIGILSSQQLTILYVFTRISGDKNDVDTALTKITMSLFLGLRFSRIEKSKHEIKNRKSKIEKKYCKVQVFSVLPILIAAGFCD